MKHRIRIGGEIKELECEIGSGVLDKNGREIFENDLVKECTSEAYPELNTYYHVVIFRRGELLFITPSDWKNRKHCGGKPVAWSSGKYLEVINKED